MGNKEMIISELNKLGFKLGCYNKDVIDSLSKPQLKKVLTNLSEEATHFNTRTNTIYIETVDHEKDVMALPKAEYKELFGYWD